jgi:hypothetical protein
MQTGKHIVAILIAIVVLAYLINQCRKPHPITSTQARMLIILSLVAALVTALFARYPFAVAAARSPL